MPYVNIKVVGSLDKSQKKQLAKKVTQALEDIAGKPKDHTYVVFDEIDAENWAVGDGLVADRR